MEEFFMSLCFLKCVLVVIAMFQMTTDRIISVYKKNWSYVLLIQVFFKTILYLYAFSVPMIKILIMCIHNAFEKKKISKLTS